MKWNIELCIKTDFLRYKKKHYIVYHSAEQNFTSGFFVCKTGKLCTTFIGDNTTILFPIQLQCVP